MTDNPQPLDHHPIDDGLGGPLMAVAPKPVINSATMHPIGSVTVLGSIPGGGINIQADLSCALYLMPNTQNPILLINGAVPLPPPTHWSFSFINTGLNPGLNLLAVVFQTSRPPNSARAFVIDL